MAKQYGLIMPGKDKKPTPMANFSRPSVFGSDDDSDDEARPSKVGLLGPGEAQKRQARLQQEKAMEEDPTIFQYDELYEDMDTKRKEEKAEKKKAQPQGPKYIKKLLETAEKRKKEYERRIERQVQKERDAEGEQFKDKESFVTSSYKKKLEEIKAAEEEEKKAEYLESIGDVQKQSNLDGFYRHLYAQKTGDSKEAPSTSNITVPKEKESGTKKERHYRKRLSGQDEEESKENEADKDDTKAKEEVAKTHITSNLDADSDFEIDSSDSEEEKEVGKDKDTVEKPKEEAEVKPDEVASQEANSPPTTEFKPPSEEPQKDPHTVKEDEKETEPEEPPPKKVKIDIWAKRTVGQVFEDALQRYFERKAARSA